MRKKTLAAALTGALAFSMVGVAYADINDTTFELSQFSASPSKSGTKKKPKAVNLKLGVKGGTKSGTGQASTSTALKITLPKGLNWNGKAWAKSKRCSVSKATQARSDSRLPQGLEGRLRACGRSRARHQGADRRDRLRDDVRQPRPLPGR